MYGYSMRPVGSFQSPQQQLGQLQPGVGSLGMGFGGGGGGGNDFSPGVYDDGGDAGSIRTPSGRMLNKRRGSVNERMRSLDIHGVRRALFFS